MARPARPLSWDAARETPEVGSQPRERGSGLRGHSVASGGISKAHPSPIHRRRYTDALHSAALLAENSVAQALGVPDGIREEWAPYDLKDPRGIKVEMKSSPFLQTWHQERLSSIVSGCARTRFWDPNTGNYEPEPRRQAQVYVFALLSHQEQATLNPPGSEPVGVHVVPTAVLDARERSQHSITLASLKALHGEPVTYSGIAEEVAVSAAKANHRRTADAPHLDRAIDTEEEITVLEEEVLPAMATFLQQVSEIDRRLVFTSAAAP